MLESRTVTKSLKFDAAHRLYGYEGRCSDLHGHTYIAEVEITGEELNNQDLLLDFGEIKRKLGFLVDSIWDHAVLLNSKDPLLQKCLELDMNVYQFKNQNPTAEVMAEVLFDEAELLFPGNVISVKIWETPTSFATYKRWS